MGCYNGLRSRTKIIVFLVRRRTSYSHCTISHRHKSTNGGKEHSITTFEEQVKDVSVLLMPDVEMHYVQLNGLHERLDVRPRFEHASVSDVK